MAAFVSQHIMGTAFEITERYSNLRLGNIGNFGVTWYSAFDSILNQTVSIKKITAPFESSTLAKSAYREVHLLSKLQHDNVRLM
ncbi:hypothetical protein N7470_004582 [Penicillium chermesinum]|nr:hypothetical protein N7470_004582 [Penicillium chermesinum]